MIQFKGIISGRTLIDSDGLRSSVTFVFFADSGETAKNLIDHPQFPKIGEWHPDFKDICIEKTEISQNRSGNRTLFKVKCDYAAPELGKFGNETFQYGKAFNLSFSPAETAVPFDFAYNRSDADGNPAEPVANSAGSQIRSATTVITARMSFSYYSRYFSSDYITRYTGTVNSSALHVCGLRIKENCGLLRMYSGKTVKKNSRDVYKVDAEIEINPNGWEKRLPNTGYYFMRNGKKERMLYALKNIGGSVESEIGGTSVFANGALNAALPYDEKVWLDSGGGIDENAGNENFRPAILKFREKRSADWSALGLPMS